MNNFGYVFYSDNDNVTIHYVILGEKDDEHVVVPLTLPISDKINYEIGEILVFDNKSSNLDNNLNITYRSSVDGNNFSNVNMDSFLSNISTLIRLEYEKNKFFSDIVKKVPLENVLRFLKSDIYTKGTDESIKRCYAVNRLLTILKKLNILNITLISSDLELIDAEKDYSGSQQYSEINLISNKQEIRKVGVFEKVKALFTE